MMTLKEVGTQVAHIEDENFPLPTMNLSIGRQPRLIRYLLYVVIAVLVGAWVLICGQNLGFSEDSLIVLGGCSNVDDSTTLQTFKTRMHLI